MIHFYKYIRRYLLLRYCRSYLVICALLCSTLVGVMFINYKSANFVKSSNTAFRTSHTVKLINTSNVTIVASRDIPNGELYAKILKQKVERLARKFNKSRAILFNSKSALQINYNIHIFYYAWYGNKKVDGIYKHWNHSYLPNWKRENQKIYPTGSHEPILDIGSNFYPEPGCYSSKDPEIIKTHLRQLKEAGIGVMVISWTPQNFIDSPVSILPTLFKYAALYEIKIALHIEPYTNRNPINVFEHLKKFLAEYQSHPALYKMKKPLGEMELPVFYMYDSYLTPAIAWKELLSKNGNLSIRGTTLDAIVIGLLVDMQHRIHIKKSHFDGFYTYFAANSFSYGSTWKNWKSLAKFALQSGLIFIPSVGPGYADTQVRPWNIRNTRHRRHGEYYDVAWRTAINSNANYISITSFNEWHEGTQIEPAIPKTVPGFTYLDYEPEGPYFYINLTKWWVNQFSKTVLKNHS